MPRRCLVRNAALTFAVALALVGCGSDGTGPEREPTKSVTEASPSTTPTTAAPPVVGCPKPTNPGPHEYDAELHDELIAMLERDQAGRTGGTDDEGDVTRTERLKHVIAEHGWPGFDLVGEDGEDAAWAIAQHSDLDPEFQECALKHLSAAVDEGQGSPGNLAYLSDRVAVAAGEPQQYGTQVSCGRPGKPPRPSTPLAQPDRVEQLRKQADLEPYADYLAEMEQICG
jgi:hypothetical protein